ncbi:MAG: oligopeptidase B, partial [Bacteroidota bacterium]
MKNTAKPIQPPVATKRPHSIITHDHERIDNYHWMRLTDEQKVSPSPDDQTLEVRDYLTAENDYTTAMLSETEQLQESLYQEIIGRIKQTDESVPYFLNGYWYYSRFEEGKEYPMYARKKETLEAEEEILLDVNILAVGHE